VRLPAFELRRCSSCREVKVANEFVRNRSTRSGYGPYCKPCHNQISRKNRERRHGSSRNYLIRYRYGVEAEAVDRALEQQLGLCAICRRSKARQVDHDHQTTQVRGVLCFSCNGALGQFGDDPQRIERAIAYLADARRRFRAMRGRENSALLCIVCREWLPREEFVDDHRRHRRKAQWCTRCGDVRGRVAVESLNRGARRYHLLTKYGIDVHEVDRLIDDQGAVCAICLVNRPDQIDHDHQTRFVLGILCGGCNAGLAQLKEDLDFMRGAIAYLERWQSSPGTVREPAASYILSVA